MAQFKFPQALALTRDGRILVADTGNHRICRVTPAATLTEPGTVEVIAGTGVQGDLRVLAGAAAKCWGSVAFSLALHRGSCIVLVASCAPVYNTSYYVR